MLHEKIKIFTNFWVITCGIRAQGSDTRPERGSTCVNRTIDLKHEY